MMVGVKIVIMYVVEVYVVEDGDGEPQVTGVLEDCIGGANYVGPNTDPSKQDAGDYSGCAAYNHSASTKAVIHRIKWMPRVIILNVN